MSYRIKQIAALLGLEYQGDGDHLLRRVSNREAADASALVFVERKDFAKPEKEYPKAGCIIAPEDYLQPEGNRIISPQPKFDFAKAAAYLHPRPESNGTRHSTALWAEDALIEDNVELGSYSVVGSKVAIGKGTVVQSGVVIGDGCRIGTECILYPGVVLYPEVQIGNRVVLQAGVIVGGDGFGYVSNGRNRVRFPQIGSVLLEDDVEIGCNTTIDRGSLGTTKIGKGTKIDNLVQIAHNVDIGKNVVIAAQTGISGSTVIEDDAIIGGQVGFGDHAHVRKGAIIGSKAGVLPGKIVRGGETYWGVPIRPLREYKRLNAYFGKLPEMKAEIDALRSDISKLQDMLEKKEH
jgi:UDP-3-O-[3-hydroxymyristoyl] glucosamine N-acyltransferase